MDNKCNILRWYPFKKGEKVLEIYNKYSILDKIKDKELDLKQVSVNEFEINENYDYIVLIGTYEYSPILVKSKNPYVEFLKILKNHLKPNGKIIIAIDNRIGIKYFVGAKSDYYSRIFEGLESKIDITKPNLLLKHELIKFIKEAEFCDYKFYYPLPDYTNTNIIFTDKFLPKSNYSKILYPLNYEIGSNILYNEINVMKQICDIKEFENFTNSYFIEISNTKIENDIKFVNYNIFRKDKYQLMLLMYDDKVEKIATNDLAKEHIKKIKEYYQILKKFNFNVLEKIENEKINSKFVKLEELDKKIINLISQEKKQEVLEEINKWYSYIKQRLEIVEIEKQDAFEKYGVNIPNDIKNKMKFVKNGFIDLTFENIFSEQEYLFYDQEWYVENIPLEFILYRAINNLYAYNSIEIMKKIEKEDMYKELKINEYIFYFEELEKKIQEEILNKDAINEYRNKMKECFTTIETLREENMENKKDIYNLYEINKTLNTDIENLKNEKEDIQKKYDILLNEYNTSRGWKIIKGVRKLLGRK